MTLSDFLEFIAEAKIPGSRKLYAVEIPTGKFDPGPKGMSYLPEGGSKARKLFLTLEPSKVKWD